MFKHILYLGKGTEIVVLSILRLFVVFFVEYFQVK